MVVTVRRLARSLVLACLPVVFANAALAQTPDPITVVRKLIDDFDRGDMQAAQANFTGDVAIIDEFAPYLWQGPGAVSNYLAAFDTFSKAKGRTDQTLKNLSVIRSDVDGDFAYIVVRAIYRYKERGRSMSETGDDVYVLHNGPGGWKIESFTWRGGEAQPEPAK
jgi:hypothetical protein